LSPVRQIPVLQLLVTPGIVAILSGVGIAHSLNGFVHVALGNLQSDLPLCLRRPAALSRLDTEALRSSAIALLGVAASSRRPGEGETSFFPRLRIFTNHGRSLEVLNAETHNQYVRKGA